MDLNETEGRQFWPLYDSYQKELEQLNQKLGKTIIAITHDDKYFGFADRVVKMEDGKIEPHHQP